MPKGFAKNGINKGWLKKGNKLFLGRHHSKETKKKLSIKIKQLFENPEYRKRVSKALKGRKVWHTGNNKENTPFYGKKHTKKWKQKMSKLRKGKPLKPNGAKTTKGYMLLLKPNHPFCSKIGYIRRCRFVMEQNLGRFLTFKEVVHHKGSHFPIDSIENRQDDSPENLQLFANINKHMNFHRKLNKNLNQSM
ncbi:hypothetical protein LCGC14_1603340 [marine sediment metagenome]|uniref:Nuclease associated modular domain-containing protein n=1 Tax=marine sediment metagenome TaxID=412755 RepID=A0A0F9KR96_9ZZZZ